MALRLKIKCFIGCAVLYYKTFVLGSKSQQWFNSAQRVHMPQMGFVRRERVSPLRSITVASRIPEFFTLVFHFITPEALRRYSILFEMPSRQEIRVEEMMSIKAPFRKSTCSFLQDNYHMSLSHRVWV